MTRTELIFELREAERVAKLIRAELEDGAEPEQVQPALDEFAKAAEGLRSAARKQVEHIIGPWMRQNPECSICRRRHGAEVQHACE